VPILIVRPLRCLILIASGVPARAASPADRARAVVQVVALGAPEPAAKGGPTPLVTLPALAGSGVIVSPDCAIVTSHHVVAQATAVAVRFPGDARLQAVAVAHLAARDDLAVLIPERTRCADFVPAPSVGGAPGAGRGPPTAERPPAGATVFKIGYGGETDDLALRTRRATVERGVVAGPAVAAGTPLVAVYVPVDPGDSGGLMCDDEGRLVGVTRGHHRARAEVGYAVPGSAVENGRASCRERVYSYV
jgi:S1-C subfamily serine protease